MSVVGFTLFVVVVREAGWLVRPSTFLLLSLTLHSLPIPTRALPTAPTPRVPTRENPVSLCAKIRVVLCTCEVLLVMREALVC